MLTRSAEEYTIHQRTVKITTVTNFSVTLHSTYTHNSKKKLYFQTPNDIYKIKLILMFYSIVQE